MFISSFLQPVKLVKTLIAPHYCRNIIVKKNGGLYFARELFLFFSQQIPILIGQITISRKFVIHFYA